MIYIVHMDNFGNQEHGIRVLIDVMTFFFSSINITSLTVGDVMTSFLLQYSFLILQYVSSFGVIGIDTSLPLQRIYVSSFGIIGIETSQTF
jgi:hypothetical protein